MNFDPFDDDFDWEDATVIGSFVDYMTEEEAEEERKRKKLEKELFEPDDSNLDYEDDIP